MRAGGGLWKGGEGVFLHGWRGRGSSKAGRNIKHIWRRGDLPRVLSLFFFSFLFCFFFFMRNTLYSRTWPPSPLPGRKKSRQCTGRCISCVCCGGGCSRCPVLLLPPGSCPDTLGGRPSPGFGTPRSLAVSGRHLGPVLLGRPPLQARERLEGIHKLFFEAAILQKKRGKVVKKKDRGLCTGQEGDSEMRLGDTMRDDTLQKNLEMYQTKPHEIWNKQEIRPRQSHKFKPCHNYVLTHLLLSHHAVPNSDSLLKTARVSQRKDQKI